jgi:hypothetical protein
MLDQTPRTDVRPDGTFSSTQRYVIRYPDAPAERYRVTVRGRFLADGAVGTLRARMLSGRRGRCDSGTHTWTAR